MFLFGQIEDKAKAADDGRVQNDGCKLKRMHESRVNVERSCWQFRFPFDSTWEASMAEFKPKVSLADLVGHQIHVVM
eukprot:915375-Prorocentrum_minimum.AAC.1